MSLNNHSFRNLQKFYLVWRRKKLRMRSTLCLRHLSNLSNHKLKEVATNNTVSDGPSSLCLENICLKIAVRSPVWVHLLRFGHKYLSMRPLAFPRQNDVIYWSIKTAVDWKMSSDISSSYFERCFTWIITEVFSKSFLTTKGNQSNIERVAVGPES